MKNKRFSKWHQRLQIHWKCFQQVSFETYFVIIEMTFCGLKSVGTKQRCSHFKITIFENSDFWNFLTAVTFSDNFNLYTNSARVVLSIYNNLLMKFFLASSLIIAYKTLKNGFVLIGWNNLRLSMYLRVKVNIFKPT